MPHITKQEQVELETRSVIKMGDACFLFAQVAKDMFLASPNWTGIHNIRRALKFPFHNEATHAAIQAKMGHMDKVDIEVAADLAFLEFYRLIGSRYENNKIEANGNVFVDCKLPISSVVGNGLVMDTTLPTLVKRGRGRPRKVASNA